MKTIQVTDEMYYSLMELSKEINGQNHRCTAMPYIFQIQTEEDVAVPAGNGETIWAYDGSVLATDEEIKEAVIEHKEWEEKEAEEKFDELNCFDIEEILKSAGWHQFDRDFVKRYQNAFFTEKACKEHIVANNYHYHKPVDYLTGAFRNPEMELVMRFLCELGGGKLHK